MRRLPNRTNTPPGGWRYFVPETQKLVGPFNGYTQLRENLGRYYQSVGYEIPADIQKKVEEYVCEQEKEYCGDPAELSPIVKTLKATFHTAVQCIQTLVSHRAGGPNVSLELQESRAQVCAACPKNTDITLCSVCNMKPVRDLITKIVGAKPTSVDAQLKFCAVCHCSTAAKVATNHAAIWRFMSQAQKDKLPPACWIAIEANELEAKYDTRSQ